MEEDYALIEKIGEGDDVALEELYSRYSSKVFNTIISYTQNTEDAEEVLQDVFVTLYNTSKTFERKASVSTWIYRIAVNKSLDFLRKKNANKRKGFFYSLYRKDTGEIQFDKPNFEHPGVAMENKESASLLFKVIDTLPDRQKTAFILTQIEDMSQKEAADIMQLTRKAVESLVQRAKGKLRKDLEKHYPQRGKNKIRSSN